MANAAPGVPMAFRSTSISSKDLVSARRRSSAMTWDPSVARMEPSVYLRP